MVFPDSNEWVVATHKWCTRSDGTPQTMKCQYVTPSDGRIGFFDNQEDMIWSAGEVANWESMSTGEK